MGSKTGDEKFGHKLHDDLTLSAICKKIKQKESEGNHRVHVSRRAWKYRVDDDESEKEACMQRCSYISRRTQLSCNNYRSASNLSPEGFCEVHTHFFRQLAQHAAAERCSIERTLLNKQNDLTVSNEDETLLTVANWSCAQQELFNDLLVEDDDEDPLKNAGVWTDEEVVRCQLVALERRLNAIRDFRKLLAEKARRLAVSHAKKMAEERKKGEAKIGNKQLRAIQLANQKYHSSQSAEQQYMIRRLKARLEWDGSEEHRLDYLKVDDMEGTQCTCFIPEIFDIESKNQADGKGLQEKPAIATNSEANKKPYEDVDEDLSGVVQCLVNILCEKVAQALASGKDLSSLVLSEELSAKNGRQCPKSALPKADRCIEHVCDDGRQHLFATCLECGSLALNFDDGRNYCFRHIAKRKQSSWEHWKTVTMQQGVVPMNSASGKKRKFSSEQEQNTAKSDNLQSTAVSTSSTAGNVGDGSGEPPIKFVVIDEGGDEEDRVDVKPSTSTTATKRYPGNYLQHGLPGHMLRQEDDTHSCARTRPFTTEYIQKAKTRRGIGQYSDIKDYLGHDFLSPSLYRSQEQLSKSMVHDLLSGGPSKVAASASQFKFSGNRRISAPGISFTPRLATRRTFYAPAPNRSVIEAPEMISLGQTGSAATSLSVGSTSTRTAMQRPIFLRSRATSSSASLRQPAQMTPINSPRYIATVGSSLSLQNWRNRNSISQDGRMRRTPVNVISPMDYSNRPVNAPSGVGPIFRRRDERQFVTGSARSRLVAIDSSPYTTPRVPRVYTVPSYPPSTYRQEIRRPVIYRSRIAVEPKAPPTAETLETAAAVASIAADLEAPTDRGMDEADDGIIGRLETVSWGRTSAVGEPSVGRKLDSAQHSGVGSADKIRERESESGRVGKNDKRSIASLSRQSSGEGEADGLAVLAMAAASRAADSDQSSPPIKSKYGQLGLEEEDDE